MERKFNVHNSFIGRLGVRFLGLSQAELAVPRPRSCLGREYHGPEQRDDVEAIDRGSTNGDTVGLVEPGSNSLDARLANCQCLFEGPSVQFDIRCGSLPDPTGDKHNRCHTTHCLGVV